MTPEQLDEIEKLAEADISDPWSEAEDGFNAALRKYALPLVKAVREARARCEYMEGLVDVYKGAARDWRVAKDTAALQRDEARAEVERLREVVQQVHGLVSKVRIRSTALMEDVETLREIHKITKDNQ